MNLPASTSFVVLFVCRANQVRSVIAERLMAQALRKTGDRLRIAGTPMSWSTTSAGVHAVGGAEPPDGVREMLGHWGIGASLARSRPLTAQDVSDADLILTAERAHRSAVVSLDPRAVHRTFTIRQFAHLVQPDHPIEYTREGGLELCEHARSRRHLFAMMDPTADDIADPAGGTERDLWEAGEQIVQSLEMFGVPAAPLSHAPRRARWSLRRH